MLVLVFIVVSSLSLFNCFVVFFFFKQKTAYEMRISDWSSDVCSSDLLDYCRHRLHQQAGSSSSSDHAPSGCNARDEARQFCNQPPRAASSTFERHPGR